MTSFYTQAELSELGFKSIGQNVLISRKSSFYGVSRISIGNNVRIDDFCVLSAGKGGIRLGSFIHIAVYAMIMGEGKVVMEDFSGLSSRVSVYSSNDDYSGFYMTNPMVPSKFTNVTHKDVIIKKHALVGSGSVILPGVTLAEGTAIGALSLVTKNCERFMIYAGNPLKKLGPRSECLLDLENEFCNVK